MRRALNRAFGSMRDGETRRWRKFLNVWFHNLKDSLMTEYEMDWLCSVFSKIVLRLCSM